MKQVFRLQKTVLLLLVLLMASFIWVFMSSIQPAWHKPHQKSEVASQDEPDWGKISVEAEVFQGSENASRWADASNDKMLRRRLSNRAYPGAPPQIPHPVLESVAASGKDCLSCHGQGGFSQKWNAYAPVAPHPHFINCRQCHTVRSTLGQFRATTWKKKSHSVRGFAHLPGGPPVIPHPLHLRGNCLSCHSGPSAVAEIRTTHPERANCRQCHVPVFTKEMFSRASLGGGQ